MALVILGNSGRDPARVALLQLSQQVAAGRQAVSPYGFAQVETVHVKVVPLGISLDQQGVELFAHAAAGLSRDPPGLAGKLQVPGQDD